MQKLTSTLKVHASLEDRGHVPSGGLNPRRVQTLMNANAVL